MGNKPATILQIATTNITSIDKQDVEHLDNGIVRHAFVPCQGATLVYQNTLYCTNAGTTIIFDGISSTKKITSTYNSSFPRACVCAHFLIVPSDEYMTSVTTNLFAMNLQNYNWSTLPANGRVPYSRANTSIIAVDDSFLVIFGGFATKQKYSNEMHKYTMATGMWEPVKYATKDVPEARCAFAYTYCSETRELWIHGGTTNGSDRLDDVWRFSFNTNTWKCIVPKQLTNRGSVLHFMCMHGTDRFFLVTKCQELDEYDINQNTWHFRKTHYDLSLHSFASFQDKIMFCGSNGILAISVGEPPKSSFMRFKEALFAKQQLLVETDLVLLVA